MVKIKHESNIIRSYMRFVFVAHMVNKYSDAHFYKKARLSSIKFTVLGALAANGGTMRPSDIAIWVNRERHNITTLIDRLSRDGLVKTKHDTKDRRSINITITRKGRKVLDEAKSVAKEIVNQVMSSISEEDATKLEKLVGALEQNTERGIEHDAKLTPPPTK
jgi:DNA-binding MarR family transcriptional regulator